MAWIKSNQELGRHPKTKRFAKILDINVPQAIGHLHLLWWWALDFAQDGDLTPFEPEEIAEAAGWEGDAEVFVDALIKAKGPSGYGFLENEDGLRIHDWAEYAGHLIDQRRRQSKRRELYNNKSLIKAVKERDGDRCQYCGKVVDWNDRKGADGATYDYIDPDGPTTLENVVVACRACSMDRDNNLQKSIDIYRTPTDKSIDFYRLSTKKSTLDKSRVDKSRKEVSYKGDKPIPVTGIGIPEADAETEPDTPPEISPDKNWTEEPEVPQEIKDTIIHEWGITWLTPSLIFDVHQALKDHPPECIREAIIEARRYGKRSWRYVLAILNNWKQEGRPPPDERTDIYDPEGKKVVEKWDAEEWKRRCHELVKRGEKWCLRPSRKS